MLVLSPCASRRTMGFVSDSGEDASNTVLILRNNAPPHAILCVILRSLAEHLLKNHTERGYSLFYQRNARVCALLRRSCAIAVTPARFLLTRSHEASGSVQSCSATPVQPVIRLGSHSSEIKDVDHDASWLALLRSFAVRFCVCSPRLCCRACECQMDASLVRRTFSSFRLVCGLLYHSRFRKKRVSTGGQVWCHQPR